jgi:hypothetical protein
MRDILREAPAITFARSPHGVARKIRAKPDLGADHPFARSQA